MSDGIQGWNHGGDLHARVDAGEDLARAQRDCAGVYSSPLRRAEKAGAGKREIFQGWKAMLTHIAPDQAAGAK